MPIFWRSLKHTFFFQKFSFFSSRKFPRWSRKFLETISEIFPTISEISRPISCFFTLQFYCSSVILDIFMSIWVLLALVLDVSESFKTELNLLLLCRATKSSFIILSDVLLSDNLLYEWGAGSVSADHKRTAPANLLRSALSICFRSLFQITWQHPHRLLRRAENKGRKFGYAPPMIAHLRSSLTLCRPEVAIALCRPVVAI